MSLRCERNAVGATRAPSRRREVVCRMTFARYWAHVSLRRNWRQLAGIAVLLGLIGGLALFSLAGARRTQSAYPRVLRSANPSTMVVDVGGLDADGYEALDLIATLP